MRKGLLSRHFVAVASKRLSATETDGAVSRQHEFDGVRDLKAMLGSEPRRFDATFTYLADDDAEPLRADGTLTWYDARENDPKRSEWRLYYTSNAVTNCFGAGDLLILARRPDDRLIVVIAERGSTTESQLLWLFGLSDVANPVFSVKGEIESGQTRLEFAANHVLELIGETVEAGDGTHLETMLDRFKGVFPGTREFSRFARSTLRDVDDIGDPDGAMLAWMQREEVLFRTLERHLIGDSLQRGAADVDALLGFFMAVFQRRRSRVGYALENHLEHLFGRFGLAFSRGKTTEGRAKPDFVFPGINAYRDPSFDPGALTMLGVKATCRDRWRQVLAEAGRIPSKHLYTLEGSISENQTAEMAAHGVRLVLPAGLHETFRSAQRSALLTTGDFIALVRDRARGVGRDPVP